jgi:hypothetical protein
MPKGVLSAQTRMPKRVVPKRDLRQCHASIMSEGGAADDGWPQAGDSPFAEARRRVAEK